MNGKEISSESIPASSIAGETVRKFNFNGDFVKEGLNKDELENLLQDAVRNNILYFDPVDALYYPQARSYQWGIKLYFESLT